MKKLSEGELLQLLETRRQDLELELRRTEVALIALRGEGPSITTASQISRRRQTLPKAGKINVDLPINYNADHTWDTKVLFVLTAKGAAFKQEVVEEICKLEADIEPEKIMNLVGVKLSTLLKQGLIKTVKEGRKVKYFALSRH